jgi:tetratricopeptide (TPR) repeat protein
MTSADDVRDMIGHTWDAPEGPGQIALAEQAMRHAEALGDPDLAFAARMAATSAFHRGGEPAKAFVTFARCLAEYDADPSRRTAQDEHLLLWFFKYVISSMAKFPEVPLERTRAVLDDMERRYRSGGHSLHAVYAYRQTIASHIGDVEQAEHWFRLWDSAPRDHNSDCAGCDPTSKAEHHTWLGRYDDAIAVAEPALAGNLTCSEQPQAILTALMIPYLHTGRLDEARDAHRRAYRAYQINPADLGSVADHVEFCGLTGNEVRGLDLIERHLGWLDHPPTPKSEMEFASAAAHILRRLVAQGRSDLVVRTTAPTTVGELAERLSARALELAARFDERNGTPYQGDRVRRRLDADPIVAYLPLSLTAAYRTRSVSAPPAPAAPDVSEAAALPLDEQLDQVEEWYQADEERAKALNPLIVAAAAEAEMTAVQRGRIARLRAYQVDRTDSAAAEREFDAAVSAFAEAGDRVRELATRVQRSMARVEQGRNAVDVQEAVEAAEELMAVCDDPVQRRATMMRLAYLQAVMGADGPALASLDRADAEPGSAPPRRHAQALMLRSGLLHRMDRIDETIAAAGEAIDLLRALGPSDQLASGLMMYANLIGGLGDHGTALACFEEAAEVASDPELRRDARVNASFMLVGGPRAGEVIDDIVEHVCLMAAEGEDRAAAYSRHRLAVALTTTRRFREAAEVAEEALAWFAGDPTEQAMADECRDLLARVYDEMGEPHAALIQLTALAEGRSGIDDADRRAAFLERMAEVLYRVDRDGEAAERYADAAAGYQVVGDEVSRVRALRRRILALHYARDPRGSSQAVEDVTALAESLSSGSSADPGVVWEHAMACYDGGFVHADRHDYADAVRWAGQAPALFRSIEAFEEAALAELRHGEILVVAGDPGQAAIVLNGVLEGLPRDHRARTEAASWLVRAFDELGEADKADELRKQYDLHEED